MNGFVKEFIEYLMYIGFINANSLSSFLNAFNSNVTKDNKNKGRSKTEAFLSTSIIDYITNMTQDYKKQIASSLVLKFTENKERFKGNILDKIISKRLNQKTLNYLMKWRKISKISVNPNNVSMKPIQLMTEESLPKERSSSPDQGLLTLGDFITRQKNFTQQVRKNNEKRMMKTENEFEQLYTFSPTLTKKNMYKAKLDISKGANAYKRLYDDGLRRTADSARTRNALTQKKSNTLNSLLKKRLMNTTLKPDIHLYEDYKVYASKKESLRKEIDMERGMTFRPLLTTSTNEKKSPSSYQLRRYYHNIRFGEVYNTEIDYPQVLVV